MVPFGEGMFLGVLTPWHIQIAHARVRGRLSWVSRAKSARVHLRGAAEAKKCQLTPVGSRLPR